MIDFCPFFLYFQSYVNIISIVKHCLLFLPRVGGGGGPGGGLSGIAFSDCFLFILDSDLCWQWQNNLDWTLGALSSLAASSRFSRSVARWTSRSAVSHIISLTASLGSILSKCCSMLKNGISCGVSATCSTKIVNKRFINGYWSIKYYVKYKMRTAQKLFYSLGHHWTTKHCTKPKNLKSE